jgi:hypothetical protein
MRGQPLGVGVEVGIHHDVEPGFELVVAARPDLDPGWRDALGPAGEGTAEHVLKRDEPVAAPGQEGAGLGVGQVGELDLHRGAAGGEGPLDPVEGGRIRHVAEAKPHYLIERRVLLGEARHAAGDRDHEAPRVCPAAGGLAGLGDELRFDPLDAPGQGGVAEEGHPASAHAPSIAPAGRGPAEAVRAG